MSWTTQQIMTINTKLDIIIGQNKDTQAAIDKLQTLNVAQSWTINAMNDIIQKLPAKYNVLNDKLDTLLATDQEILTVVKDIQDQLTPNPAVSFNVSLKPIGG